MSNTIAQNITALAAQRQADMQSKENIRQAIIAKGVDVPENTPLSAFDDKVALIDEWVAPADWIQLEEPANNEILMLASDINPYYAFLITCIGGYSVDWGDGITNTWASDAIATHTYAIGSGKYCSRGYTTFKIRIFTTSGNPIRYIQMRKPRFVDYTTGLLWVRMNTIRVNYLHSSFGFGQIANKFLERLELPASLAECTSYDYLVSNAYSLKSIRMPYVYSTGNLSFTVAFSGTKLKKLDLNIDSANISVFDAYGISTCVDYKLPSIINNCTVFRLYSNNVAEIVILPTINSDVNCGSFLSQMLNLRKIVFNSSWDNRILSCDLFLRNNQRLSEIVSMPRFKNGLQNYMFENCANLKSVRLAITTQLNTNIQSILSGCELLESVYEFPELPNITNYSFAFYGCRNLKNIDNLDKLGDLVTGMDHSNTYASCFCLNPVGGLKIRNKITGRFVLTGQDSTNRAALQALLFTNPSAVSTWAGASPQIDVAACNMDATALNALFASIIATSVSFAGKTVRITWNPGAATCDTTIITNAGGTVNKTT